MRPGAGAAGAWLALAAAVAATGAAPTYRSPDSLHYLDVARSLRAGLGPASFHLHLDAPAVPAATGLWPGGYPAALAALEALGAGEAGAPALLNALALALTALAAWWLARLAALPPWLGALATAAALAHPALLHVLSHAWSEPLFVALTCAALALLAQALLRGQPPAALAAGLAAGLASGVRYAGLFLVGHALAASVAWGLAHRWRARRLLAHLALLLVGPLLLAPLAVGANLATYGRPFGLPRLPLADLPGALLDRAHELAAGAAALAGGLGTVLLLLAVLWPAEAPARDGGAPRDGEPGHGAGAVGDAARRAVAWLAGSWCLWYPAALLASVATILTDPLDLRLLSPVAPALVLTAFAAAAPLAARHRAGRALAAAGVAAALLLHLDASLQRRRDPPRPELAPALAAAARRLDGPATLFVASRGWALRQEAGVAVLEDGYPDMRALEAPAVFAFLAGPGRGMARAVLVFDPGGTMPAARIAAFLEAAARAGWRREASAEVGEVRLLALRRGAAAGP